MYRIVFYKDKNGKSPVYEFISNLKEKGDKNSRINYEKILDIINLLRIKGLNAGMPYIRRIRDGIWEMRPLRNRILFFSYRNEKFVLLHCF